MRCVPTPEFTAKTRNDPVNALILPTVGLILTQLQIRTFDALVSGMGQIALRPFKDDVYIAANGDVAIFVRKTTDAAGECLVLLDLMQNRRLVSASVDGASKDPRLNPLLNPRINADIDPHRNDSLNPIHNDALNPKLNPAINPRLNPAINPRTNPDVNPRSNRSISPTIQLTLNPKHNSELNPAKNDRIDGPFVYDLNLNRKGFLVRADDRVNLLFGMGLQLDGFAIAASDDCHAVFDATNNWIGFLVPDGQGNSLRFNANNKWEGLVIW